MVDLSKKILIVNGYTIKEPRSISIEPVEDEFKHSEKSLNGKRRILYSPDPNRTIKVSVERGSADESFLLGASTLKTVFSSYYKDSSVEEYSRGITIAETAVNPGPITDDNGTDVREFTIIGIEVKEALINA